jgi:hypothetical protein
VDTSPLAEHRLEAVRSWVDALKRFSAEVLSNADIFRNCTSERSGRIDGVFRVSADIELDPLNDPDAAFLDATALIITVFISCSQLLLVVQLA